MAEVKYTAINYRSRQAESLIKMLQAYLTVISATDDEEACNAMARITIEKMKKLEETITLAHFAEIEQTP